MNVTHERSEATDTMTTDSMTAGTVIDLEPGEAAAPAGRFGPVTKLVVAASIGAAVSLSLGVYGNLHEPTGQQIVSFGFPSTLPMKAWFTTGAFALALVQLVTAAGMWNRLPGVTGSPAWLAPVHRWSGTLAFLLTLPVAYHCLWALGFQDTTTRVLVHSILGCAFYGAITVKLLALRIDGLPAWALPVLGGSLVALLTGLWFSSSLWFFQNFGFPGV